MFESGCDVIGTVPMPPDIASWIAAFVDQFHVERVFHKRKRDRAGGDSSAGCRQMKEPAAHEWSGQGRSGQGFSCAMVAAQAGGEERTEAAEPKPDVPVAGRAEPSGPPPRSTKSQRRSSISPALPKLEELTATTDITAFLRKGVPEHLRNAALRKSWALDPAIRNYVNPALDYAYDWNTPGGVPGSGELGADVDVARLVSQIMGEPAVEIIRSDWRDVEIQRQGAAHGIRGSGCLVEIAARSAR